MSALNNALNLLMGADAATPTPSYQIERSLRFNSSDSAYLSRTPASAGNRRTWTWAGWVKRSGLGGLTDTIMDARTGSNESPLCFNESVADTLSLYEYNGSYIWQIRTTQVFRDASAWYHIVAAVDTTQATAANRVKLYVNGVQVTALAVASYPSQNHDTFWNTTNPHVIGQKALLSGSFFDGYLADVHFIDGQALDPTSFTEVDATTGQLVPIEYTGSYGPLVNQSEVWSNALSGSLKTPTAGFDANPYSGRSEGVGGLTFTPATPLVFADKVEVYDNNNVTKSRVNSGSYVQHASNTWVTVASGGGTITTMDFLRTDNPSYDAGFYAIRVDGKLLVDQGITVTSNGFHLPFSDNSTAAALGTDTSGAGNNWTVNNISVTAGAGNDSLRDSPTNGTQTDTGAGGEVSGGYPTVNPLRYINNLALSNGNLQVRYSSTGYYGLAYGTMALPLSGKWYWEVTCDQASLVIGVTKEAFSSNGYVHQHGVGIYDAGAYLSGGSITTSGTPSSYSAGDVIGVAVDMDNSKIWFSINGTYQTSGDPATGTNAASSNIDANGTPLFPASNAPNSSTSAGGHTYNFGQRPFAYTAPSGFKALCTTNLPDPVVAKPSTVMDVVKYDGNGSTQTISGLGFSPDFVWIKSRSTAQDNNVFDAVRGVAGNYYALQTNATSAEGQYGTVSALTSDGFTLSNGGGATNFNGTTYVAWTWDAGGEPTTDNVAGAGNVPTAGSAKINGANMTTALAGSIAATRLSVNTSAGFSIATFTPSSGNFTVGHGLNAAPEFVILKSRTQNPSTWFVYHKSTGPGGFLRLQDTSAFVSNTGIFQNTNPTSSVFYSSGAQIGTTNYVMYSFAPVNGYSSFGSYTGNGSPTSDGPFVYTGFRPRWLMARNYTNTTGVSWHIYDTARDTYNILGANLKANSSGAETTIPYFDILSNGFKVRSSGQEVNGSGQGILYAAFAESPFQYARAR